MKYDVFMIGAVMAGAAVAKKCAKAGMKARDLKSFLFSYPTMASDVSYMA
ncbi:hypothetical protein [Pontibacter roseus]|nr:hypothetical protein [Pontibacter roseus]